MCAAAYPGAWLGDRVVEVVVYLSVPRVSLLIPALSTMRYKLCSATCGLQIGAAQAFDPST